ncbi:gliding motility-associated C-terminal domain-containing protein [Tellurirhabdus bombi]|uniref:gliding motility-associated C-terminal domain-containing protein n=1 Tax=Tellurirhabdus bombi TaxID=2907205 RepID=UPI001F2256C7|nr:gliding motility-associated C-terminal domain-containing protein [Tellurirhabdus bombi]
MSRLTRLLTVFLLLLAASAQARHIHGGDISMKALSRPGQFRIELNQFLNGAVYSADSIDVNISLQVFSKKNHRRIEVITLNRLDYTPLVYGNEACSKLRQLNIIRYRYGTDHQFNISNYAEPEGYYISWTRCCRDNDISNLAGAGQAGMVFYLEFPAMTQNGAFFKNSSPEFSQPNGAYICINDAFSMNFQATDADGDQLRYSLVEPWSTRNPEATTRNPAAPAYLPVTFAKGIGVSNMIPGPSPLRVDGSTGRISVRASDIGLYVFTVQVDEYRNGVRIGSIRRDFQLPVVDCSQNTPPPAIITQDAKPVRQVNWCSSSPLTLAVENRPEWAFQWQLNGTNIAGENRAILVVKESGTYTVIKSFSGQCAGDTISEEVKVQLEAGPKVTITASRAFPVCDGDTLTLTASTGTSNAIQGYSWLLNGQVIAGETKPQVKINQSGLYTAQIQSSTASCTSSDTLRVRTVSPPSIRIQASSPQFCEGDSVRLSTALGANFKYNWSVNETPFPVSLSANQISVKQGGTYFVRVTTPEGCSVSATASLTQLSKPQVQLDSILTLCASSTELVALQGWPLGGRFRGTGVQGTNFNPTVAGTGRHEIFYSYTGSNGCRSEVSRWAIVSPALELNAQPSYVVMKGEKVRLEANVNVSQADYIWSPPTDLSDPRSATPIASPATSTSYKVVATSSGSCTATATVQVEVVDRLFIPEAFSPNGDGINDTWEIRNISSYADCEIAILNRWGEVIYFSKGYSNPWDGISQGSQATPGVYQYHIKTGFKGMDYKGQLVILK